jgi:hypothetical protein
MMKLEREFQPPRGLLLCKDDVRGDVEGETEADDADEA